MKTIINQEYPEAGEIHLMKDVFKDQGLIIDIHKIKKRIFEPLKK